MAGKRNPKAGGEKSFEQLTGRLEEVVGSLETGELPLEKSLELFEEGVRLSREASSRLDAAERKIEELLADGSEAPLADGGDAGTGEGGSRGV